MKFELTKEQIKKVEDWKKALPECYVGAVGGAYSFVFTPTGIGTIVEVTRADGHKLDLTDWDNF